MLLYFDLMLSQLSALKKRSIFKIAVDLIKADNRIHCKEINILDNLQKDFLLTQEEIDLTHYITLAEAISTIYEMDQEQISYLLDFFNKLMRADSDISNEENILLTAIIMSCTKGSHDWARVISIPVNETKLSDSQIVYLEKERCENAHNVFGDKYDNLLISKAFGDIGFQLFYLPSVLEDLGLTGKSESDIGRHIELLQKSIGYLTPYGSKDGNHNASRKLENFDTTTFFKVVLSSLNLNPDIFPFKAFLLIKIRDSVVLDDKNHNIKVVDFLCIDMSDEIKKRILCFVSNFSEQSAMLPYEGYYRMLYDHLSSDATITSSIIIDEDLHFLLENLGNIKMSFESSPQSRTLYLLLLYYGTKGLSQITINKAIEYLQGVLDTEAGSVDKFNLEEVKQNLIGINTDWSSVIYNTITIYQAVSTKDELKSNYLSYICSILNHRSSLKTYINKAFSATEGLANPEQYHIHFDKEFGKYFINASSSLFFCIQDDIKIPVTESSLWKKLI